MAKLERTGTNFHSIALQRALRDGRPIAFVGEWVYGGCEARDFSCALEPLSPCNKTGVATLDYPRMVAEGFPWDVGPAFQPCMLGGGGGWGREAAGDGHMTLVWLLIPIAVLS